MPTTTYGIPYPNAGDATIIPSSLQTMADHLDKGLPLYVRPTADYGHGLGQPPLEDPQMFIDLPAGDWRVRCITAYTTASDPNRDVDQAWAVTGGITLQSRFVSGPELAMTDVSSQRMVHRPVAQLILLQSYGVHPSFNNRCREDLVLSVTTPGRLTLVWGDHISPPESPVNSIVRSNLSYLRVQRIVKVIP
jgi:hypothetical protein